MFSFSLTRVGLTQPPLLALAIVDYVLSFFKCGDSILVLDTEYASSEMEAQTRERQIYRWSRCLGAGPSCRSHPTSSTGALLWLRWWGVRAGLSDSNV